MPFHGISLTFLRMFVRYSCEYLFARSSRANRTLRTKGIKGAKGTISTDRSIRMKGANGTSRTHRAFFPNRTNRTKASSFPNRTIFPKGTIRTQWTRYSSPTIGTFGTIWTKGANRTKYKSGRRGAERMRGAPHDTRLPGHLCRTCSSEHETTFQGNQITRNSKDTIHNQSELPSHNHTSRNFLVLTKRETCTGKVSRET
jgi:hypothetical protein